ncbi:type 1 glutamine amidotransferase domain-containing protein [Caldimonas brevitalea]|uniref:Thiamine biosynthesis protein ThiJ n=1 Tax=Caldimonas brevitalea TaxID=413882 RepID=A0A0G3BU43_9BURK|nr:type 1 glutamine amidotransferase domain-containing protein [Caldimonas brevitalea]AKJ30055.1 thiamine biosynthesis protein ThiJ [Caldimonas brevitalea]
MKYFARIAALAAVSLAAMSAQAGNVLVVLSDAHHLELKDGKRYVTGFFLNELLQPVKLLLDAGHQVTFATPQGKAPSVDPSSIDPMHFGGSAASLKEYQTLLENLKLTSPLSSPVVSLERVEQIGYGHFDAVYVPGGHAPMQDLLASPQLGRLLTNFHRAGKTTALVCHGPVALLSALPDAVAFKRQMEQRNQAARQRNWIYAGYRFTVISNDEEAQAKAVLNGGVMKFYPQTALEQAGGQYSSNRAPWTPHVVIDRELITGQNPASALQVGQALLERLKATSPAADNVGRKTESR